MSAFCRLFQLAWNSKMKTMMNDGIDSGNAIRRNRPQ